MNKAAAARVRHDAQAAVLGVRDDEIWQAIAVEVRERGDTRPRQRRAALGRRGERPAADAAPDLEMLSPTVGITSRNQVHVPVEIDVAEDERVEIPARLQGQGLAGCHLERQREVGPLRNLDRFDYIAIFLLIAGTYTPFCLITLRGATGRALLAAVWLTAFLGIAGLYVGSGKRHWPRVLTYVLMGWLSVFAAGGLLRALPRAAIAWMIAGGVVYTVGALVYVTRRPRLWPGRFGYHDLWHCMVLAGSACHFLVILKYVAPAA